MRTFLTIILLAILASVRADDLDLAKQAAAKADDAVQRLTALRGKGLASELEVKTAEFQAILAKAAVARLNYDDKEETLREAAVTSADAILKRVEAFHKQGLTAIDDVDLWRKQAAAARIELAAMRGQQKTIVAQTQILVNIEERRLARVQALFDRGAVAKGEVDAQKKVVADAKRRLRQAGGGEL